MKTLYNDIALEKIEFSKNGKDISFILINTENGNYINTVICKNVIFFAFMNNFDEDEELPCFIGDVSYVKIHKDEIKNKVKDSYFKTLNIKNKKKSNYFLIKLESGALLIEIICENHSTAPSQT